MSDAIFKPASHKQEMMMKAAAEVEITIIGGAAGSGKSYILQLLPLMFADCPKARCTMFRRTTPQITGQGGIWDTAKGIYNQLPIGLRPRIREKDTEILFPNLETNKGIGMKVKYSHMQNESDKYNIQGLQFTLIGVDEGCQFEWSQLNLAA